MSVNDLLQVVFEAETLAEAVERGVQHFNCARTDIETAIQQAPRSGFLGLFGRRPARVLVRLIDRGAAARVVCEYLLQLSRFPAKVRNESVVTPHLLNIESPDPAWLIGRHGQTLDALQFLLNSLLDREFGSGERVVLDTAAYRARRRGDLVSLAERLIDQARKSGRSVSTPPLPPDERRVLHGMFERERDIVAHSKGQGIEKKLIVSTQRG
jgi:spoIIIJ-associated protein